MSFPGGLSTGRVDLTKAGVTVARLQSNAAGTHATTTDTSDVETRLWAKAALQPIDNNAVDASAGIVGTKLSAGSGVLTHLNGSGVLDNVTSITARSLDNITDGSTYARPLAAALSAGKVNLAAGTSGLANQLPEAQLADNAVTDRKVKANELAPQHMRLEVSNRQFNSNFGAYRET